MGLRRALHFNYNEGYFFVTFTCAIRKPVLARIIDQDRLALTDIGQITLDTFKLLLEHYPNVQCCALSIMPDHVHACLRITPAHTDADVTSLGIFVREIKRRTSLQYHQICPDGTLWSEDYHDWVICSKQKMDTFCEYVRANPDRLIARITHPTLFEIKHGIQHPKLNPKYIWSACGDLALLDDPRLVYVKVSRRVDPVALAEEIDHFVALSQKGAILVGGFISPGEKAVAQAISKIPSARIIRLCPGTLADYRPHGRVIDRIQASRTLILSAFPEEPSYPINYDCCHANNRLAEAICTDI